MDYYKHFTVFILKNADYLITTISLILEFAFSFFDRINKWYSFHNFTHTQTAKRNKEDESSIGAAKDKRNKEDIQKKFCNHNFFLI